MDQKHTILSVDDSPINNKLIEAYFRREYNVVSVGSGQEALVWLKENTPDVILLDIMMPVMDGTEVLQAIQEDSKMCHIPVIMVTAKTEMESIKTTLNIGALDYVKKPIDFTELQTKVLIALQINKQNREISKYKTYYSIHQGMIHAQRIQRSILPDSENFRHLYPKAFILNLPKHIISGDFYWIHQNYNQKHLALFDCTGHGVPAAMLTMIAQVELHNIASNGTDIKANQIFSSMSLKFGNFLNSSKDTYTQYDGMDGIFCSFYPHQNKIEYTGAKRSLVLIRNEESQLIINNQALEPKQQKDHLFLYEISGDRLSIGKESEYRDFTLKTIKTKPGDRLFLFSDGITDQLGGEQEKRLKKRQFFEKLISIQGKSMNLQKSDIFKYFEDWKKDNEQTDDILIIGMEL